MSGTSCLDLDEPQDDVAVAFAGPAHGPELVDDGRLQPDQPLALIEDHEADREGRGDRLEGGLRDSETDHWTRTKQIEPRAVNKLTAH